MSELRAPFPWYGGKSLAAPMIWRAFGNVPNYVEPFAGSLATLLARPSTPKVETVNDKDGFIANFWRAVQHAPEEVAKWCSWPVNEVDLHARHRWLVRNAELLDRLIDDPEYFDPKIAGWWCWGVCTWIGNGWCRKDEGTGRQWRRPNLNNANGSGVHALARQIPKIGAPGMGVHALRMKSMLDVFEALSERLRRVRVVCGDWSRVLGRSTLGIGTSHGMSPCGIVFDAPYKHELRDKRLYREDERGVSDDVRDWAIEHGDDPNLRIALCGLDGEHEMPSSWAKVAWAATSSAVSRANERVWFSPHCLNASVQRDLFEVA
jgi:DNA adenine methylase